MLKIQPKQLRMLFHCVLILLFAFGGSFSASAAGNGVPQGGSMDGYLTTGWQLSGGISHLHYSFDSIYSTTSSGNSYLTAILGGCVDWDAGLSSSIFTYTYAGNQTVQHDLRFIYVDTSVSTYGTLDAWTVYFDSNDQVQIINSDPTSEYHHVRIYVNNHNLYNLAQSISSTPYTNEAYGVRAVMAHEVGHTLGLSHIIANIATVLMEPYATTTYAYHGIYGPTSYDIDGVVAVGY